MTTSLCRRSCNQGCWHWFTLYLPTFTLFFATCTLYLIFLFEHWLPTIQKLQVFTHHTQHVPFIVGFVIFHIFFAMFWLCFFLVWSTEPGKVPTMWRMNPFAFSNEGAYPLTSQMKALLMRIRDEKLEPESLNDNFKQAIRALPVVERKGNNEPRFCWKCSLFKPDRVHHCSICNRCVLRMDHHCLWVGNCIGYHNHKYFMLFLLYGVLSALTACICMIPRMIRAFKPVWDVDSFLLHELPVILAFIVSALVVIVIGIFFFFHLNLIVYNTTTIERREKLESDDPIVLHKAQIAHIKYDRGGVFHHFCHLFGYNPLIWFLPIVPEHDRADGNGTYCDLSVFSHPPKALSQFPLPEKIEEPFSQLTQKDDKASKLMKAKLKQKAARQAQKAQATQQASTPGDAHNNIV